MANYLTTVFCLCLALSATQAQLYGDIIESFGGENGLPFFAYRHLQNSMTALEANVRSGAIGGCESGVIGPLTRAQSTATIQFRGRFSTPPTVSLSVSDLATLSQTIPVQVQIRPGAITPTSASVILTDGNGNVAALYVSYMACPSNASPMVSAQQVGSTGNGGFFPNIFGANPLMGLAALDL